MAPDDESLNFIIDQKQYFISIGFVITLISDINITCVHWSEARILVTGIKKPLYYVKAINNFLTVFSINLS